MKLTNVYFKNFKNKGGNQELSGLDLFLGQNGTGKSSVLEAVQLGISGNVNGRAKPKDIFKLSADSKSMTVGISTNNGIEISRHINRNEKIDKLTYESTVKYSEKLEIIGAEVEGTGNKAIQAFIKENLGDFQIGFDFSKFVGMTDTEKRNFVLSFCKDIPFEEEYICSYLDSKRTTEDEEIYSNLIAMFISSAEGGDIQSKVSSMLSLAKEQLSYNNKDSERQVAAIQKLNTKKASLEGSDKGLAIDKKKVEKLNEQIVVLEKEVSVIETKNKACVERIAQIEKIEGILENLKKSKPKDVTEISKELVKLNADVDKFSKENSTISENLNKISVGYAKATEEVNKQRKVFDNIKDKGIELKTKLNTEMVLVEQVKGTKKKCAINPSIPCNADFTEWLTKKNSELKMTSEILEKDRISYKNELLKLIKLEEELIKLTSQREDLIKFQQVLIRNINNSNISIRNAEKEIEEAKKFEDIKFEKIKLNQTNLDNLQKEGTEVIRTEEALSQISDLKEELNKLKTIIAEKEQIKVVTTQIKEADEEFDKITKKLEACKTLVKAIGQKGLQGEIFKKLVAPIVDLVNQNYSLMGMDKPFNIKTVNDQDNEVFDFGIGDEAEFISFDTLSTGQKAILSVAIVVAFIRKAKVPMKVLCLDNIESLDKDNIKKVLTGLAKMYEEGFLDNVLVAGCIDEDFCIDNFSITRF